MSTTINYSDPNKLGNIVIEDASPANSSGLTTNVADVTFIGKNASNYAAAINGNFLHLVENFASPDSPTNPIQGQLWYNNDNQKLLVRDVAWRPVNGVWQQPGPDKPNGALTGDVWVDTAKGQLFLTNDGTNWTLVGPSYSSTLKTGSYPDTIKDNFGEFHSVIKHFIDDKVIEIISNDTFIPQQKIDGFDNILSGLNLTANNNALVNATAYGARNLYVSTPVRAYITGNSFARNDIDNNINAVLTVRDGLLIGADPSFSIKKEDSNKNVFINSVDGGRFAFRVFKTSDGKNNEVVVIDGNQKSLGINLPSGRVPAPNQTLEIGGNLLVNGIVEIKTTASQALIIDGKAVFGNTIDVTSTATFNNNVSMVKGITLGQASTTTVTAILTPLTDSKYDVGTDTLGFRNIYANKVWANLEGTANAANSLTNTSVFKVDGQVQSTGFVYKGVPNTYTFTTVLGTTAISAQSTATYAETTATLLVLTTATGSANPELAKITKAAFLADIYKYLIPAGTIIPYAGFSLPVEYGDEWLFCDGATVSNATYPRLYQAIGFKYGKTTVSGQFKLPDMRGRVPMGYVDMTNGFFSSLSPANDRIVAPTPDAGQSALGVIENASYGGTTSTLITGTVNGTSGNTGPFASMNFIIKV